MKLLLQEIRRNPLLWLLVFVPVALAADGGGVQDFIFGTSLRVTAPLCEYDGDKLVNIGTNRWSFTPENRMLESTRAMDG